MNDDNPLRTFRAAQSPPWSQLELASVLGVSGVTISRWETGERKVAPKRLPIIQARTGIEPQKLRPDVFGEVS